MSQAFLEVPSIGLNGLRERHLPLATLPEAVDLLRIIEEDVRQRRFGAVARLTIQRNMPQRIRELLLDQLKLTSTDLYAVDGPLGQADLMALTRIDRPDLWMLLSGASTP